VGDPAIPLLVHRWSDATGGHANGQISPESGAKTHFLVIAISLALIAVPSVLETARAAAFAVSRPPAAIRFHTAKRAGEGEIAGARQRIACLPPHAIVVRAG
jgi:hypothetical protein